MRIVSLLPSSTEIVCQLGLEAELAGITHECDYPPSVKSKPVLIESVLGHSAETMSAQEIDAKIRETLKRGEGVYRFKPDALKNAKPDVIITQGLCDVCAIPNHFVIQAAKVLRPEPQIISLDPQDLTGILTDIRRVGEITGKIERAGEIVDALEERVGEVAGRTRELPASKRPRVAVIEWADPVFAGGHWVPEMVELAGGQDVLAKAGEPSTSIPWEKVLTAQPEIVIVAPCGYDLPRARKQAELLKQRPGWDALPAVKAGRVYALDANATLSRPGPRIVDGLEDLAQILQPEVFPMAPAQARWAKV